MNRDYAKPAPCSARPFCIIPQQPFTPMTPHVTSDEAAREAQSGLLARSLAEFGVRNIVLENFHAGKVPHSTTGDFSDVSVVTPDGNIPRNELSRLSDPADAHPDARDRKMSCPCLLYPPEE